MKNIVAFIDNFPGESSFVIPVYWDYENNYYVEKFINEELIKHSLDDKFNEKFDNIKKGKEKSDNKFLILAKDHLTISEENIRLYAFKFNRDFIIIGDRKNISENILYGIGTIDNNLLIYNEIKNFIFKTGINNPRTYLDEVLTTYYNRNEIDKIKKYESEDNNYLYHSMFAQQIPSLSMVYYGEDLQTIKKESKNFIRIIKNRNSLEKINKNDIIFRLLKTRKTTSESDENQFAIEINRINTFLNLWPPLN